VRRLLATLVLVGSMTSSVMARAEESTPPAEVDAASLFREAEARYVAGDVAGALESMQRAYDLSSRAELLYNLGELRRELGQCREARRDYEAYLERVATGARRERALEALDGLRTQCAEEDAVVPPPSPPSPPPQSPAPPESKTTSPSALALATPSSPVSLESSSMRPMTIAGWSAIGAGVLAGGFATYFAVDAANQANRLERRIKSIQANPDNGPLSASEKAIETRGERAAMWGRVLGIGAAGFAAAGVSLLVFGRDTSEANHAGLSFEWRGDGAAAAYGHSF
jgi:tetratricopeptide (TPR) repeat protein